MRRTLISAVAAAAVTASLFAATPAQAAEVDIKGSGSSFAGNFLIDCASRYTAKTGNKVSYTATSSGRGRASFAAGTDNFAGSDSQYGSQEALPPNFKAVPVIGGPVAIVFNVAGVNNLRLDAAAVSGIFTGTIKKWNDPAIAKLNPTATLPDKNFVVVYRSSNSGTTQNFQDYLYQNAVGPWPTGNQAWAGVKTGSGQATSADLVQKVKMTSGGIGYADLSDVSVKLGKVTLKNAKGEWVKPSVASASKMLSAQTIEPNGSMNINFVKKVSGAYQLSIVTYLMIPTTGTYESAAKAFATYAVNTCSKKPAAGFAGFTGENYKTALKRASS
ncbi:MAG: substrate-binding domain-containing protein [Candidatus Nanopelagicales bacterium]|nr:substrate-binding domain-containing protein [Candidatus Nanopelagicales bacterium]